MKNLANKKSKSRSRSKTNPNQSNPLELMLESRKATTRQESINSTKKDFLEIDIDNSGYIDIKELHKGLKKYGIKLSLKKTKDLLKKYDDNPDGKIEMGEFMQLKTDIDIGNFRKPTSHSNKTKRKHKRSKHKHKRTKRKHKRSKHKHKRSNKKKSNNKLR